jgi:ABC-type Fe3+-siderophore transport system permease subunit
MQETSYQINDQTIQHWLTNGLSSELVREELHKRGATSEEIDEHLKVYKKAIFDKRRFNACLLLAVGALIGFIGCIMAMINPFPDLYNVFLYGTTSLAALIAFWGLYLLLE